MLVGRVEGEENTWAVVQIKNKLAAFGHPKAFTLSENGFQWLCVSVLRTDRTYRNERLKNVRAIKNMRHNGCYALYFYSKWRMDVI